MGVGSGCSFHEPWLKNVLVSASLNEKYSSYSCFCHIQPIVMEKQVHWEMVELLLFLILPIC